MYKYLFGPVPSRRLGMSLGVDLVPHKVCSLDCVYCECGKTTLLTTRRQEYIPFPKIAEELDHFFSENIDPDYITFSGSGEPLLNKRIGEVLDHIKKIKPEIPVALITNGTLLNQREVRGEILNADLVLPSLDAATQQAFTRINRPSSGLTVEDHINGLIEFRKQFAGSIWLEILIIPGMNNDPENLNTLLSAARRIKPDKIQLNTLDRPGTIEHLRPASMAELKSIKDQWNIHGIEIISPPPAREKVSVYRPDTETAILETIRRRPCTAGDLAQILGLRIVEMNKYLDIMEAENKIISRQGDRGLFYRINREH